MMTKAQRDELQARAGHFNGMFARWRRLKTDKDYTELEGAIEALSTYWFEVKSDNIKG